MHQFCLQKIIKLIQKIVKKEHPHTRDLYTLFNKDYEDKMNARSTRIFNRDPEMREMIRLLDKIKISRVRGEIRCVFLCVLCARQLLDALQL